MTMAVQELPPDVTELQVGAMSGEMLPNIEALPMEQQVDAAVGAVVLDLLAPGMVDDQLSPETKAVVADAATRLEEQKATEPAKKDPIVEDKQTNEHGNCGACMSAAACGIANAAAQNEKFAAALATRTAAIEALKEKHGENYRFTQDEVTQQAKAMQNNQHEKQPSNTQTSETVTTTPVTKKAPSLPAHIQEAFANMRNKTSSTSSTIETSMNLPTTSTSSQDEVVAAVPPPDTSTSTPAAEQVVLPEQEISLADAMRVLGQCAQGICGSCSSAESCSQAVPEEEIATKKSASPVEKVQPVEDPILPEPQLITVDKPAEQKNKPPENEMRENIPAIPPTEQPLFTHSTAAISHPDSQTAQIDLPTTTHYPPRTEQVIFPISSVAESYEANSSYSTKDVSVTATTTVGTESQIVTETEIVNRVGEQMVDTSSQKAPQQNNEEQNTTNVNLHEVATEYVDTTTTTVPTQPNEIQTEGNSDNSITHEAPQNVDQERQIENTPSTSEAAQYFTFSSEPIIVHSDSDFTEAINDLHEDVIFTNDGVILHEVSDTSDTILEQLQPDTKVEITHIQENQLEMSASTIFEFDLTTVDNGEPDIIHTETHELIEENAEQIEQTTIVQDIIQEEFSEFFDPLIAAPLELDQFADKNAIEANPMNSLIEFSDNEVVEENISEIFTTEGQETINNQVIEIDIPAESKEIETTNTEKMVTIDLQPIPDIQKQPETQKIVNKPLKKLHKTIVQMLTAQSQKDTIQTHDDQKTPPEQLTIDQTETIHFLQELFGLIEKLKNASLPFSEDDETPETTTILVTAHPAIEEIQGEHSSRTDDSAFTYPQLILFLWTVSATLSFTPPIQQQP